VKEAVVSILFALLICIIGVVLLQTASKSQVQDETASIRNPDPRGLLLLHSWLKDMGTKTIVYESDNQALVEDSSILLVIPPPEKSSWLPGEVKNLMVRIRTGQYNVLILCDPDRSRQGHLKAWFDAIGMRCHADSNPTTAIRPIPGKSFFPAFTESLEMKTRGQLVMNEGISWWPLYQDEAGAPLITEQRMGEGKVYLAISASIFQNDGLDRAQNALIFKERFAQNRTVMFDESHHHSRAREVLHQAFEKKGVQAGALAFFLLFPLSLLGLAPRSGDAPEKAEPSRVPTTEDHIRSLAALYEKVKVGRTTHTRIPPPKEGPEI
jgi:hypothetical protein